MFNKKLYNQLLQQQQQSNDIEQCLMPLCPICIRQHSQYHLQVQSKPSYYSIAETVEEVQQTMHQFIGQLQKHQDSLSNVMKQSLQFQKTMKDRVSKAKAIAISWIQQKFKSFQAQTLRRLNSFAYEKGLRSIEENSNHFKDVQSKLKNLYKMVESLQTQRFLATIITFLKQENSQLAKNNRLFSSYLEAQTKVYPKVSLNLDIKNHFLNTLEKLVKIQVQQIFRQRPARSSPVHSNRALNSTRLGRQQKKQEFYTPQNSARFIKDSHSKQTQRSSKKFKPSNSPYYLMHRKSVQIGQNDLQINNLSDRFFQYQEFR